MLLLIILEIILFVYFVYVVLYTVVFTVAGRFYKSPPYIPARSFFKFAIFIPSYKEDGVILSVARQALNQNYPANFYTVYVIADSLQPETVLELRQLPLNVVEVSFDVSTKVKSLTSALKTIEESYDYAVILDADNVMYPDFLERLNATHQLGFQAIQGQRLPKNSQNELAFLDGLSEAINNHIYRQGTVALNLSSSISGSGISVNYPIVKEILMGMNSVGGFDREMELLLLQRGIKVFYLKDAGVLDEKVQKANVFDNQRRRWISSQYHYLVKYFNPGMRALFNGDFTYFNSAVLRNIQLPRLVNIGLLILVTLIFIFLHPYLYFGMWVWIALTLLMGLAMLLAIPKEFYNKQLLRAVLRLPGMFYRMFILLFKLKGANKKFIHTPHYNVEVELKKPK